jgi:hypothetical protein
MFIVLANVNANEWITIYSSQCPVDADQSGQDYQDATGNSYVIMFEDDDGKCTMVMEV